MEQALQQRERVYRWRLLNKERYNELGKKHSKTYYDNNADVVRRKKREYYHTKKALKTQENAENQPEPAPVNA